MYTINIVYALLKQQDIKTITVKKSCSIEQAIIKSRILEQYKEIDLSINKVGIYNQIKSLEEIVKDGDRIEIYRPLIADPKEVRRKRAEKQKQQGII